MPTVAITDSNNMFGALEAFLTLPKSGIQPIIGRTLVISHDVDARSGTAPEPNTG